MWILEISNELLQYLQLHVQPFCSVNSINLSIAQLLKKVREKSRECHKSQTAALPRHQDEEETDKPKQAQIEQTYEKR